MADELLLDVSAFGTKLWLVASNTFPAGIDISTFSDDADGFDSPTVQIGDAATGPNGTLLTWSKGVPIPATINVAPGSEDDLNLQALWDANRVGQGKQSARDVISLTATYPNGQQVTLDTGIITSGQAAGSISGSGRLKTKQYEFKFQNRSGGSS